MMLLNSSGMNRGEGRDGGDADDAAGADGGGVDNERAVKEGGAEEDMIVYISHLLSFFVFRRP